MSIEESRPVLARLYEHAVRPEFTCRFRWTPGAVAIWDNRTTMHYAINNYDGQRRLMYRTNFSAERPTSPAPLSTMLRPFIGSKLSARGRYVARRSRDARRGARCLSPVRRFWPFPSAIRPPYGQHCERTTRARLGTTKPRTKPLDQIRGFQDRKPAAPDAPASGREAKRRIAESRPDYVREARNWRERHASFIPDFKRRSHASIRNCARFRCITSQRSSVCPVAKLRLNWLSPARRS